MNKSRKLIKSLDKINESLGGKPEWMSSEAYAVCQQSLKENSKDQAYFDTINFIEKEDGELTDEQKAEVRMMINGSDDPDSKETEDE